MTARALRLLGAGAARRLVESLRGTFETVSGAALDAAFAPVGVIAQTIDGGAAFDVVITSTPRIADLRRDGRIVAGSAATLGSVPTCVAVRADDAPPALEPLADVLRDADAIYCPDLTRSTAGAHLASVLDRLGIAEQVLPKVHAGPHGAAAMQALALATEPVALGCTQLTEILATRGVRAIGPLPAPYGLSTGYHAAVGAACQDRPAAARLISLLTDARHSDLRRAFGFQAVES